MSINAARKREQADAYLGRKMPLDRAIKEQKSWCDTLFLGVQADVFHKFQDRMPSTYQECKTMARKFKELASELEHLVALEDGLRRQL